jgi:tRNA dimethylallyltransferase
MIDIISPRTKYNVSKFKKQAEKIIRDILEKKKLPIICGGTGFWIKAIVDNVNFPEVKPDWSLRKKLENYPAAKLFAMLKKMDPERTKTIDTKNKVRLIRAIEICKAIGNVPTSPPPPPLTKKGDKGEDHCAKFQFLQISLKLSKNKLHQNIEQRVKLRFKQGMIKEVEKLHRQSLSWKKIQSFGLAYFWIPLYLQNKISKVELIEKVIQVEKNYAKRQVTWFKRDKRIK